MTPQEHPENRERGDRLRRIAHPFVAALVTWIVLDVGTRGAIAALFLGPAGLVVLLLVPVLLALAFASIAKACLGRLHALSSVVMSGVLVTVQVVAVTGGQLAAAFPTLGPMAVAPFVALGAIPLALLQHPGKIKIAGLAAMAVAVMVIASPSIAAQNEIQAEQQQKEEREYQQQLQMSIVPFTSTSVALIEAQVGQDSSSIQGSLPEGGGVTIRTDRLWTTDDLPGQLCSAARFALEDATEATACTEVGTGVVQVTTVTATATVTVRVEETDRMVVVRTAAASEGLALVEQLVPLGGADTEKWFRAQWERDAAA